MENTRQKAVSQAQKLLQQQGFNGFSFQHIADLLEIKKPSLYAHFESKEDLGNELIQQYLTSFQNWAEALSEFDARHRLMAFFDLFFKFSKAGAMYCPVAALTADLHTLPPSMKKSLKALYDHQTEWLKKVILAGQHEGSFRKDLKANELVQFVISLSIGSQFLGRISGEAEVIKTLKQQALMYLEGIPHGRKSKV